MGESGTVTSRQQEGKLQVSAVGLKREVCCCQTQRSLLVAHSVPILIYFYFLILKCGWSCRFYYNLSKYFWVITSTNVHKWWNVHTMHTMCTTLVTSNCSGVQILNSQWGCLHCHLLFLRVWAVFHKTIGVCHVYLNFKLGYRSDYCKFLNTERWSLLINILASNNCNLQKRLPKWRRRFVKNSWRLLSKSSNFLFSSDYQTMFKFY